MNYRIGERVTVDAAVTGDGEHHSGWVADVYEFARRNYIEVKFDHPSLDGRMGCIVTNPGLVRKEVTA
ncbi:MAG: hypothetical protein J6I61_03180 [Prevotella sp.]|nr:hypothetical protein [Prevotella sp.]MBQ8453262.1 hypothetical protein [Prevotella sp.]